MSARLNSNLFSNALLTGVFIKSYPQRGTLTFLKFFLQVQISEGNGFQTNIPILGNKLKTSVRLECSMLSSIMNWEFSHNSTGILLMFQFSGSSIYFSTLAKFMKGFLQLRIRM